MLTPNALSLVNKGRSATRPAYSEVFVMEYLPERALRAHRRVDDEQLHSFLETSWYLEPAEVAA